MLLTPSVRPLWYDGGLRTAAGFGSPLIAGRMGPDCSLSSSERLAPSRGPSEARAACRGTSQVHLRADQHVRRAAEVSASVAARGPMPTDGVRVLAGPVTGQRGRVGAGRLGTANDIKPGVSNRHRHTVAEADTSSTRSLMRPQTRLNGARRAETRHWRAPSVAVRGNADGAHRPPQLCTPTVLAARTPVRYASVDSAI